MATLSKHSPAASSRVPAEQLGGARPPRPPPGACANRWPPGRGTARLEPRQIAGRRRPVPRGCRRHVSPADAAVPTDARGRLAGIGGDVALEWSTGTSGSRRRQASALGCRRRPAVPRSGPGRVTATAWIWLQADPSLQGLLDDVVASSHGGARRPPARHRRTARAARPARRSVRANRDPPTTAALGVVTRLFPRTERRTAAQSPSRGLTPSPST